MGSEPVWSPQSAHQTCRRDAIHTLRPEPSDEGSMAFLVDGRIASDT